MTTSTTQPAQYSIKSNTESNPKVTAKVTSLPTFIVEALRAEPDRIFAVRDLVDITGGTRGAVKQALSRLSEVGKKGAGPITRVSHGFYKYDSAKDELSLASLVRSGTWKIENLTFVTLETPSNPMLLTKPREPGESDKLKIAEPKPGYPVTLPTGQQVFWGVYPCGTELIRLSTNGQPPFSPDAVLTILYYLEKEGFDTDSWKCTSCEYNQDFQKRWIEGSIAHQIDKGLLLKCYQHGYSTRIEVADRRPVLAREVLDLFGDIHSRSQGKEALTRVAELEKRVGQVDKTARGAYKLASNGLQKASEIMREKFTQKYNEDQIKY